MLSFIHPLMFDVDLMSFFVGIVTNGPMYAFSTNIPRSLEFL